MKSPFVRKLFIQNPICVSSVLCLSESHFYSAILQQETLFIRDRTAEYIVLSLNPIAESICYLKMPILQLRALFIQRRASDNRLFIQKRVESSGQLVVYPKERSGQHVIYQKRVADRGFFIQKKVADSGLFIKREQRIAGWLSKIEQQIAGYPKESSRQRVVYPKVSSGQWVIYPKRAADSGLFIQKRVAYSGLCIQKRVADSGLSKREQRIAGCLSKREQQTAGYLSNMQSVADAGLCISFVQLSTQGMTKNIPGPRAPPTNSRPSRNITARSYSCRKDSGSRMMTISRNFHDDAVCCNDNQ